ncbi:MAG: phytanoyl-CoA dioxygenase family protein [Planctomycetota bacterium]|nr:phytanoyl-CoA dioxygenase family protein [Planctomycetota bacterium]
MGITPAQVARFQGQGYTVLPEFFTAHEIQAFRAELDRLRRAGHFNNVRTEGDGKSVSREKMNLQICPLVHKSTFFRALPFHPRVLETIPQLIGDPAILHLDQVFLKPARHGTGTNWHQDNAYFKIDDPMRGTAMWIAVHDATIANGTLNVIPGAFRENLEHGRDPESNHHIRCYPDESKAVAVEVPAGGAVFFCYGVPHCTRANQTDRDRAGVAYHFLHESCYTDEYRKHHKPLGTYLTGSKSTGGLKEYGVKVAGTWEAECEVALSSLAAV